VSSRADPATAIEQALSTIRRWQQQGRLQRAAMPGQDLATRSLVGAKFRYLDALAAAGRGLGVGEIAELIGVDQPRASRLTAELEREGLVSRARDPGDQRRHVVTLTPAGRQPVEEARARRRERVEQALQALTPGERRQLADLLTRFLAAWR
jgi:DNA-binding MarR family transcriptional regulator